MFADWRLLGRAGNIVILQPTENPFFRPCVMKFTAFRSGWCSSRVSNREMLMGVVGPDGRGTKFLKVRWLEVGFPGTVACRVVAAALRAGV